MQSTRSESRAGQAERDRPAWLRRWREVAGRSVMKGAAVLVVLLLLVIAATLVVQAWPVLGHVRFRELLFSTRWDPSRAEFGLGVFVAGTLIVTLIAMIIAVPTAILSAIYLAEYTSPRMRLLFKPVVDLLAGIPPVVYGLWGILAVVPVVRDVLAPWLDRHLAGTVPLVRNINPTGYGILTAGFVLAMMIFPIIVSVSEEVLRSVPDELRYALYSVGCTRWEVAQVVAFRSGRAGLLAAVVLGLSRAIGETLAVVMLIGNVPQVPRSLFDGGYTLSGLIANTYGELMSIPMYASALMTAAVFLLLLVLVANVVARLILDRQIAKGDAR